MHSDQYFTTIETAQKLRIQPCTLEAWRCRGGGPVFVKFGRAVRYRLSDLEAFVNGAKRENTSQGA